jgi:hypothetical protein
MTLTTRKAYDIYEHEANDVIGFINRNLVLELAILKLVLMTSMQTK